MNLTDDFILKCLFGCPVLLDDICAIFPATLKEIVQLGYEKFLRYLNIVLIEKPTDLEKSELGDIIENLSTFEYLLLMVGMDAQMNQLVRDAFRFFTHDEIGFTFDPPQLIIGPKDEQHIMKEEDFLSFRKIIRKMYFIDDNQEEIEEKKEDNPIVARIKAQMRKNHEKLAKAKKVSKEKEDSDLNFSDLVASLAIAQCGLNIISVQDMTYYAFHDQLKRMGWRDRFNINNRAALAGAKLKKNELKHWMRPIDSKDK